MIINMWVDGCYRGVRYWECKSISMFILENMLQARFSKASLRPTGRETSVGFILSFVGLWRLPNWLFALRYITAPFVHYPGPLIFPPLRNDRVDRAYYIICNFQKRHLHSNIRTTFPRSVPKKHLTWHV